jgi:dipeptidyl aminopeptidase/acylaminoacyl peptidase
MVNRERNRRCSPARRSIVEPLEHRLLLAAAAPVSPGTVYYRDYNIVETSFGTFDSYNGVWSMKGDGSAKTRVPAPSHTQDPSRLLHGERWGLGVQVVPGNTYPNGHPRQELFAFELGGQERQVQLTNDPSVQPGFSSWSIDDSFVSYSAVTWKQDGNGDEIYQAADGQQWDVDAGVFRAPVSWAGGLPDAETAAEVMDAGLRFTSTTEENNFDYTPDVDDAQWSPAGTRLVYQRHARTTSPQLPTLHVASSFDTELNPVAPINLGKGRDPEWKPDGDRIVFFAPNATLAANWVLKTANPDGSGVVQITKTTQSSDSSPSWSPDGKQIVFTRNSPRKGNGYSVADVMRVSAAGGTVTNLTGNLDNNARAFAWRADVQANDPAAAIVTAGAGPGAALTSDTTPMFSDKPVHDSDGDDGDLLADLLA